MKSLLLLPLTADRLEAAVAIDQRCLGGLWSADGYAREIDSPNSDLWTLEFQQTVIGLGCLWSILEEAHITILAIDQPYRRQGLARLLLWALLMRARQRGLEWATLEVRPSNQAAIALYQSFEFETVGQRRRYYQNPTEDALILWRKGLHHPEFADRLQVWQQQIRQQLARSGWEIEAALDRLERAADWRSSG